jgi:hypothetical protein
MQAGSYNDTLMPLVPDSSYPAPAFAFSELLFHVQLAYQNPFSNVSLKLTNDTDLKDSTGEHFPVFLMAGEHLRTNAKGYPDFDRSSFPFSFRPDSLKGYYMFSDSLSPIDNWGRAKLMLSRYDSLQGRRDTIGYLDSQLDLSPTNSWTAFSIPVTYLSEEVPDSLSLVFFASREMDQFGILWLDELQFDYSQVNTLDSHDSPINLIYPNPVQDILKINAPSPYLKWELYNSQAQKINNGNGGGNIDAQSWPKGVYLFRWENINGESGNKKVLKY